MILEQINASGEFSTWSEKRLRAMRECEITTNVGQLLLFENQNFRVWEIHLNPGQRMPFHRHCRDYSWAALTPGEAISHYGCGKIVQIIYERGDVVYYHHDDEGDFIHDLENQGDQLLSFCTVEYK